MEYIEQLGVNAKAAEPLVSSMGTNEKNRALAAISEALRTHVTEIIGANQLDIENAHKNGMSEAMIDRLTLTEARIEGMAEGVDKVISLPDPIGAVIGGSDLPNGLHVIKKRVPIGTIGIIFESRPNVTVDAAALCFKAGNAVILRGGSDAINSNKALVGLMRTALESAGADRNSIQLVEDTSFMDTVRKQVEKAASDASTGVSAGWDDRKVLDRMQANLLPISDMVSSKITELGNGAGTIVDKKVDDTVHKFLPGKLGDWVSDKVGNKVNNIVQNKVNDLGGQVTDLIDSFIKQFTCGKHEYGDFEILKNPTCTEKGQKGKICKKCGKITEKTDIDAAGHAPVTDPAVAPTETTDGLTEGSHCSVCGAVLTAQEVIPMRDPTIDTWFSRAATTEADAKAAGFDSVDAANAALDAALTAAGFDPANAEHFTVQVNSSIGVLPNDRFSESGVTGKLTLPEGTRGKTAQTYYVVQMFTADTRFHKAGDVVVTPVSIDTYAKTGLQFTVYSEAVMAIAWKAQ